MEEKKWFTLARKSVSTSRNKLFFKNWIPTSREKSSDKRILFQVYRKPVSTCRNGDFI